MIIYTRALDDESRRTELRVAQFRKHLNALPLTSQDRRPAIRALLQEADGIKVLSDIVAAVVTQLVYREHIPPRRATRTADPNRPSLVDILSRIFDQKTQSLGYAAMTNGSAWREGHRGRVLVVVAGCQTEELYVRRARAAVRLVQSAELYDALVIFSGANPTYVEEAESATPSVATPTPVDAIAALPEAKVINEAAQMRTVFEAELGEDEIKRLRLKIREESKSGRTAQNIVRSFQEAGEHLKDYQHLAVVSSSFHLPRMAGIAGGVISKIPHSFKTVSLVGSELPYKGSQVRWNIDYMKSACYEAMTILLENSNPDDLFRPPTY